MGGNSIKSVKISPIPKENIEFTLKEIENQILKPLGLSNIPIKERIGGSLFQKEVSGDIDIFIEQSEIENSKVFYENLKSVCNSLGINEVNRTGITSSIYFPQYDSDGEITDLFTQVDFLIIPSIKFSKNFKINYQKTKYKNAHMQLLLNSILKYITLKKIDDDKIQHYGIHPFSGILFKTKQKNPKTEKYKEINKEVYSYNLNDAISLINQKGYNITEDDLNSFESLYSWMKNNIKDLTIINKIKEEISDAFKNSNLTIPKELNENMKPETSIKNFNAIVAVGRFQPFHKGHLKNIKRVVDKYPDLPLYILNIHNTNNKNTVFSPETTKELIETSLENNLPSTLFFIIQKSLLPDAVDEMIEQYNVSFPVIWILGDDRKTSNDKSSFFHIEGSIVEGSDERIEGISGTKIRKAIYNNDFETFEKMMNDGTNNKEIFIKLKKELMNKINEVVSIFNDFYGNVEFLKEDIVDVVLQLRKGNKKEIEKAGEVEVIENKDKEDLIKNIKYVLNKFKKKNQEDLSNIKGEFFKNLSGRKFPENEIEFFWERLEFISLKESRPIIELPLYKLFVGENFIPFNKLPDQGELTELAISNELGLTNKDLNFLYSLSGQRKAKSIGKGEILLIFLLKGLIPNVGDLEVGGKKIEIKGADARLAEQGMSFNWEEMKQKLEGEDGINTILGNEITELLGEKSEIKRLKIEKNGELDLIYSNNVTIKIKENKTSSLSNLSNSKKSTNKKSETKEINIENPETIKNLTNLIISSLKIGFEINEEIGGGSLFIAALKAYILRFVKKYNENFDYIIFLNDEDGKIYFRKFKKNNFAKEFIEDYNEGKFKLSGNFIFDSNSSSSRNSTNLRITYNS